MARKPNHARTHSVLSSACTSDTRISFFSFYVSILPPSLFSFGPQEEGVEVPSNHMETLTQGLADMGLTPVKNSA